ncbi:MAG TPA: hypothetical protein VGK19_01485 [Capsulimonadaceae bacterium]|jgi:hypothetical protein
MNCERIQQLYTDVYENTISAALKHEVDYHLSLCGECRADYARFADAMQLLDMPITEVEVPLAFRAQVLAKIAEQPKPSRFPLLDALKAAWSAPRAGAYKLAGAVMVAATVMVVAVMDQPKSGTSTSTATNSPFNRQSIAPSYAGVFHSLSAKESGDKIFHNFTIQLPKADPTAFVTAYVLQNGKAMTDDTALTDPASATLAWRENDPLSNSVQVNIPVAVVSSVPAGSTLAFLVQSTGVTAGTQSSKEVAFVPLDTSGQTVSIAAGDDIFTTLQAVAASQNINIIVDDRAIKSLALQPYSAPANVSGATDLITLLAAYRQVSVVKYDNSTYAIVAP